MSLGVAGLTGSIIEYALDGLSTRQAAIASNIANAHSVGYRPIQVSFESTLADALSRSNTDADGNDPIKELPAPTVSQGSEPQGTNSRGSLEMQTVLLSQNVLQYQSLIAGLNKYMSAISVAINEGRK